MQSSGNSLAPQDLPLTDGAPTQQHASANESHCQSSTFRGVTWNKKCKKWQAVINHSGRHVHLGTFVAEAEAALAFDRAAVICRGVHAKLNFDFANYVRPDGSLILHPEVEQRLANALAAPVIKRPRSQQFTQAPRDTNSPPSHRRRGSRPSGALPAPPAASPAADMAQGTAGDPVGSSATLPPQHQALSPQSAPAPPTADTSAWPPQIKAESSNQCTDQRHGSPDRPSHAAASVPQPIQAALPAGCQVHSILGADGQAADQATAAVVFSTPSGSWGAGLYHHDRLYATRRFPSLAQAADHSEALLEVAVILLKPGATTTTTTTANTTAASAQLPPLGVLVRTHPGLLAAAPAGLNMLPRVPSLLLAPNALDAPGQDRGGGAGALPAAEAVPGPPNLVPSQLLSTTAAPIHGVVGSAFRRVSLPSATQELPTADAHSSQGGHTGYLGQAGPGNRLVPSGQLMPVGRMAMSSHARPSTTGSIPLPGMDPRSTLLWANTQPLAALLGSSSQWGFTETPPRPLHPVLRNTAGTMQPLPTSSLQLPPSHGPLPRTVHTAALVQPQNNTQHRARTSPPSPRSQLTQEQQQLLQAAQGLLMLLPQNTSSSTGLHSPSNQPAAISDTTQGDHGVWQQGAVWVASGPGAVDSLASSQPHAAAHSPVQALVASSTQGVHSHTSTGHEVHSDASRAVTGPGTLQQQVHSQPKP